MELINNTTKTLKDDLSVEIKQGSKLSIAAACFSIYAFQELKEQLSQIEELRFIFTSPTFVTEKAKKERREFYIPRLTRERNLYGTEFEIKLRNELTQKAIARECAEWIRQKVTFKSNVSDKCHWFPYAGLYASFSLLDEIDEILETSRGKSKRRTARIDKAILSYYDDKRIHEIKQRCRKSTMESHVKKMVNQAINAHLRGEYVLTIACLATLWEGMLKQKMPAKTRSNKELKKDIKALVVGNGYEEILGDFYNNLIIGTCYGIEDVKEGVPNRNGIAHSWYKKYPNKKASLNAILLTDFIINLNPKETTEVTENGQTENADSEQG